MELKDRLRAARRSAGLTQREVARRLGIAAASVAQWEIGRSRPDITRLALLAEIYGVRPDLLLADAPPSSGAAEIVRDNIIELFMRLTPDQRTHVLDVLRAIAGRI